jgi:ABC-type uncharacterized transport system auxiliary subunit
MMMRHPALALLLLACCTALACTQASVLRPKKQGPSFHRLRYEITRVQCGHAFQGGLCVWDFATGEPFNRTRMAVAEANGTLAFSRDHQWAALPGIMVANRVRRDLSRGSLFPLVVGSRSGADAPYEMTGRVHTFACRCSPSGCRAALAAELTLTRSGSGEVLFHETYRFSSETFPRGRPSRFVQAMSGLAGELSERLRRDLCSAAKRLSAGQSARRCAP